MSNYRLIKDGIYYNIPQEIYFAENTDALGEIPLGAPYQIAYTLSSSGTQIYIRNLQNEWVLQSFESNGGTDPGGSGLSREEIEAIVEEAISGMDASDVPLHASTHTIGGVDSLSYSDIGAAAATHTHTATQVSTAAGITVEQALANKVETSVYNAKIIELQSAIDSINATDLYVLVDTLPTIGVENKIYLVPVSGETDEAKMYAWINEAWEAIGSFSPTVDMNGYVSVTGAQTISGNKSFTGKTIVPTPVDSTDATTKAYVDGVGASLNEQIIWLQTNLGTANTDITNLKAKDVDLQSQIDAVEASLSNIVETDPVFTEWRDASTIAFSNGVVLFPTTTTVNVAKEPTIDISATNKVYVDTADTSLQTQIFSLSSGITITQADITDLKTRMTTAETKITGLQTTLASVPIAQEPFSQDYSGSNTITLPSAAKVITEILILDGNNSLTLLQAPNDFTYSGGTSVTINSSAWGDGKRIKITYFR